MTTSADPTLTDPVLSRSVRAAIIAAAQRFSDRTAIQMAGQSMTYEQLVSRAGVAAASIGTRTGATSNPIVVQVGLSPDAVALVLGVFCSGHPIVALDPQLPADRVSTILGELTSHGRPADLMIADAEHLDGAGAVAAAHDLPVSDLAAITTPVGATIDSTEPGTGPSDPADSTDAVTSIQFTSGSTGAPKGVLHPNGMWLCDSELMRTGFSITPGRRVALCLPISFGAGLNVLIGSLINGADITAVDPRDRTASTVLDALAECRAEVAFLAPALLRALTSAREATAHPAWMSLRRIITTGEALTSEVAQAALGLAPAATVTNWVGSSETSAIAYFDLRVGETVAPGPLPAGVLAPHKSVTIADDGRVVVSSRYLARGYLDPASDEGRFSRDADGVLSFRTGDRGSWDGATLTLTGRVDDAVKIRGYLVEPAEIHRAIMSDGDLTEAAVIARTDPDSGRSELVAYVAPIPGCRTPPVAEIRTRLRQRLPEWMIPAHVIELAALPRTARGKVDRASLPTPSRRIDPPVGDLETSVAAVWAEALGLDGVGRDENVYALGADSLTVAQILVGLTRRFGVALTQADAASAPTVATMARTLQSRLRPEFTDAPGDGLAPTTVPLHRGVGQTVFCFAGAGASALVFVALADHLTRDPRIGSIYGFQPHGLENRGFPDWTIGVAARRHLRDLRRIQPGGPYVLLGHSLGGLIALEVARRLRRAGEEVALVMTLDTFVPQQTARAVGSSTQKSPADSHADPELSRSTLWRNRSQLLRAGFLVDRPVDSARAMEQVGWRVGRFHRPTPYHGRVLVVLGADNQHDDRVWTEQLTPGDIAIRRIDADHMSIVREPHISEVVEHFLNCLP
ncbi:AMP-binding protein [Gordonia aichiensis]